MPKIKVKYRCCHLSCRNPKCYEKTLVLDRDKFNILFEAEKAPNIFRSPSGSCLLKNTQLFEILEVLQKSEKEQKIDLLEEKLHSYEGIVRHTTVEIERMNNSKKQAEKNIEVVKKQLKELKGK